MQVRPRISLDVELHLAAARSEERGDGLDVERRDVPRIGAGMDVADGDPAEGSLEMHEALAEPIGAMDQRQPALCFQEIGAGSNPALETTFGEMMRATKSEAPPGANGTIMRMSRFG